MNENNIPLLIYGASGHASVIADAVRQRGRFQVAGFLEDSSRAGASFCGAVILGGREKLAELAANGLTRIIIGVGACGARLELAEICHAAGFEAEIVVHPAATVSTDAMLGAGTFVAAGAVIGPGAKIGRHAIVNTCASVDHDCALGEGVHICPGARLAGYVQVDRRAWVGIGSTVIDQIVIGEGAMVGAGSVVVKDVPPGVLAYGNPARIIRKVNNDGS